VADISLETPGTPTELYLALTSEELDVFTNRPVFTGDVIRLKSGRLVALVQHPCAMRRGAVLAPKLLVCGVKVGTRAPDDWSKGHFKRMFLPDMVDGSFSIEFEDLDIVNRDEVDIADRVAILSEFGVNLLVQRWIHHNSRVIVPTITIHLQTTGPFEEADLFGEATDELLEGGFSEAEAASDIDEWLGQPHVEAGPSRREMLNDPQSRGAIRSALRRHVKDSAR
jgi:hypothetical protein